MKATTLKTFFDYTIFSLTILLVFQLIFEQYLVFPTLVSWLGHFHPVVLHLPIALVFVTIIQYWRKDPQVHWYIAITALLSLLTAHSGYILSAESDSKGNILYAHQWMGTGITFLLVLWHYRSTVLPQLPQKVLQGLMVVLIVLTGHFGGMVTHGEGFLSMNLGKGPVETAALPEDPNIYAHIIQPILDRKCVACHNENKSKGGLLLTDHAAMVKGGESGSAFDEQQGILHRIKLPTSAEEHMPPENEQQLDAQEMLLLGQWLESGASSSMRFSELEVGSEMHQLIATKIEDSQRNQWAELPQISNEKIANLSTDYCTIIRKYGASSALQVIIFPHKNYSGKELASLKSVSENIVELNLSNLPISGKDIKTISSFENLETLILSGSSITNEYLEGLSKIDKLRNLNIYGTEIDDTAIPLLSSMQQIEKLYVYETGISDAGIDILVAERPELKVINFSEEALTFAAVLPPPKLKPTVHFFREPFFARIEHPLDDISIKYTLDGSEPDESSSDVKDSILIDQNFTLRYYASKDGWEPSQKDSVSFLQSNVVPINFELAAPADQKYLGTGKELLFDLEKGSSDFGDDAWMAFRQNSFELLCEFENEVPIDQVTISSMVRTGPHIFPPTRITIYGGAEKERLKRLYTTKPAMPKDQVSIQFKYFECPLESAPVRYLKIRIDPLKKLPAWHQAKGEEGWFFIDEVVLSSGAGS